MIEYLGQRASDSNNSLPQQCLILFIIPPPLIGGDIKRCFCLTSVCLSVAYIGPKSRTERPRKTIIGTEVAHVTRDSETTFRVERSRSPGRFTHRSLNVRGRCSGARENVLGVRNYCYVASARRRARRLGAQGEERGGGISCRHAHSLLQTECVNWYKTMANTSVPCNIIMPKATHSIMELNSVMVAMLLNSQTTECNLYLASHLHNSDKRNRPTWI